jgi:hypothetical protein|tara:strand:- start:132 stop:593 length:462 start_codon:yes stop_codon:yes gene_type:complete
VKKLEARNKHSQQQHQTQLKKVRKEVELVEAKRDELREKLSQVDVIIQKTEIERDEQIEKNKILTKSMKEMKEQNIQYEKEKEQQKRLFEKEMIKKEEKIIALQKESEHYLKDKAALEKKHIDAISTLKNQKNQGKYRRERQLKNELATLLLD